jgi:hypothetical protein
MPTAKFSGSPKLNPVMKDFIEKFQHSFDQFFLSFVRWSVAASRRKMPVRELAHCNCQFITIVVDTKISHLGMRRRKAGNGSVSLIEAKSPIGKACQQFRLQLL